VSDLAKAWRKRLAAIRIANGYFTLSLPFLSILVFYPALTFAAEFLQEARLKDPFDERWAFVFISVIMIACFAVYFYFASRPGQRSDLKNVRLEAIANEVLPQIYANIAEIAPKVISVHLSRSGPSIGVTQRRKTLILTVRPEMAAVILLRPKLMGALLAHELTHAAQWDTSLGHVWYRLTLMFCYLLSPLYGLLIIGFLAGAIVESLHNGTSIAANVFILIGVITVCLLVTLGTIMFALTIRRWMEYSADITAALAGFGDELVEVLKLCPPSRVRCWLRRTFSAYPTPSERIFSLARVLQGGEIHQESARTVGVNLQMTKLRLFDYLRGLFFLLIPTMLPMVFPLLLLIQFLPSILKLIES